MELTKRGGVVPAGGAFALKKRLLVPRWWLEGVMAHLGSTATRHDRWTEAFLVNRLGVSLVSVPAPSGKVFESLCHFWNLCVQRVSDLSPEDASRVMRLEWTLEELALSVDEAQELSDFRRALLTPLETLRVGRGRGRLGEPLSAPIVEPTGAVASPVRSVSQTAGGKVQVEFAWPVQRVLSGEAVGEIRSAVRPLRGDGSVLASLNPSVLRAQGRRPSLRRLALYLYLELEKHGREESEDVPADCLFAEHGFGTSAAVLEVFSKQGRALYDHGVLGWLDRAPSGRIADLKARRGFRGGALLLIALPRSLSDVLHYEKQSWRRSSPELKSTASKAVVSSPLREKPSGPAIPTRDAAERSLGQNPTRVLTGAPWRSAAPMASARRRQGRLMRLASKQRRFCGRGQSSVDQEKADILKLAQYYESLSPTQREDLDREVRGLESPRDLKEWLLPLLDRLH